MTPIEYDFLRALLKERSGLVLTSEKHYLLESRLLPVVRKHGLAGLGDLVQKLRGRGAESLAVDVVEAMTTNESFFFRDKLPFEHFQNLIIPQLLTARAKQKRIRIWCAAAASGQEPYSLAMILKEMGAKLAGFRIEIVATDLSNEILEKAKSGLYSQFEVQRGLPIQMLVKNFSQAGEMWQVSADIRAMVQFRALNLLQDFSHLGMLDVVFCRNVLIYFDEKTKIDVIDRVAKITAPDGFLSLGAAETVVGLTDSFKSVPGRRGIYALNEAARAASPAVRLMTQPALAAGGMR